jgi:hypothetical protein
LREKAPRRDDEASDERHLAIFAQMPIVHRVVDSFPGNAWTIDFLVGGHPVHDEVDRKMVTTKQRWIANWSDCTAR